MQFRNEFVGPFILILCALFSGCGSSGSVSSPQPGELTRYLQNNPDAPNSSGGEPAGINGPTELPNGPAQ
jgi:hypothetical protein